MNIYEMTVIENEMKYHIDKDQMSILKTILNSLRIQSTENQNDVGDIEKIIPKFISAKRIEGCSEKTLKYYKITLNKLIFNISKNVREIDTDDIRKYLADYQKNNKVSKVTVDNVRRIFSTFFSWLEDEDHILKSPVRRIKKIKTTKIVKDVFNDESMEIMRDKCKTARDLALIDILASTGMRVGELVNLDRNDIDFHNRECKVTGKGDKERIVYFDARAKVHISNYLNTRTDPNSALFVSLNKPHRRLNISGVEKRLRDMGKELNIPKIHPHKFRRTLATKAIDKGMPIEQVQKLLGHSKIDTTMGYAMVDQNNVKNSHRKFIA